MEKENGKIRSAIKPTNHNRRGIPGNTIPVRYSHFRQICSERLFQPLGSDRKYKKGRAKVGFASAPDERTGLHVEVITPLLPNQDRMLKELPATVEVIFKGKPVYQWRTNIYWKDDGRIFLSDLTAAVGRALRISHTCYIREENVSTETETPTKANNKKVFTHEQIRVPRPAVERYVI